MKMSKESYDALSEAITRTIVKHGTEAMIKHRRSVGYVKNQFISFCWSVLHSTDFDYTKLYDEDLDDSHIETALKRILARYK